MTTGCFQPLARTLAPFLYPFPSVEVLRASAYANKLCTTRSYRLVKCEGCRKVLSQPISRRLHTSPRSSNAILAPALERSQAKGVEYAETQHERLDPRPEDYSASPFVDACTLILYAGSGGHGCVSFLREKYIEEGPPNGGDGGSGGNIYIQAVRGETSLHKLARKREVKAGRGKHGQGSSQGGQRGEDIMLEVPVGTVVREIERWDPVLEEEKAYMEEYRLRKGKRLMDDEDEKSSESVPGGLKRDKWLLHPGANPAYLLPSSLPGLPKPRRSNLSSLQPQRPITLDLDTPMDRPMLLAAGSMGGLGNPHFVSMSHPRPKFATKGDGGMKLLLHFELKLLADVGLVGLPNAGKSTLLRTLSRSRTRIGSWAFTTLRPSVGTVVLDDHKGRPRLDARKLDVRGEVRTRFTIADIPGLIEDAHLDKGLGLDFLRHVERAAVLAFVLDLSAGDAVGALKALWREVAEYEALKEAALNAETEKVIDWNPEALLSEGREDRGDALYGVSETNRKALPPLLLPPMSSKPWFVVANKADLPGTEGSFERLQTYLRAVSDGELPHPSRKRNAWKKRLEAVPVSAIRQEGVDRIPELVLDLLGGR